MLAFLLAALLPSSCSTHRSGDIVAEWSHDRSGALSATTERRSVGELVRRCRVRLPDSASAATVRVATVRIAFTPAGSKRDGSGLVIRIGSEAIPFVRVAGEDWIEARNRTWTVPASKVLVIEFRLIDASAADPVRVDLVGLEVEPTTEERASRQGPPDR